jgi:GNAT superfamily N-acetyltransferase
MPANPVIALAAPDDVPGLCEVLIDAVVHGASVGWTTPPVTAEAESWWNRRLVDPDVIVWVARIDGVVVGTVSLVLEPRANGRHRAEVSKLMVHSSQRGRGLGRILMHTLEAWAVANGRSLLLLDTETGSAAERLYAKWGWNAWGTVPGYAISEDGTASGTTFFMKRLP